MVRHVKGKIVNIASTFGMPGFPDRVAYCSSKSGVIGLTRLTISYENDPKMIKFVKDSTALGRWGLEYGDHAAPRS